MTTPTTWRVDVRSVFFKNVDKETGEKKGGRMMVRQLLLTGEFIISTHLRVTRTERNGQVSYSVAKLVERKAPVLYPWQAGADWHKHTTGKWRPRKDDEGNVETDSEGRPLDEWIWDDPDKWVKHGPSLNRAEALAFLTLMIGNRREAKRALLELAITLPPSKKRKVKRGGVAAKATKRPPKSSS